jgi:hypothetical protein
MSVCVLSMPIVRGSGRRGDEINEGYDRAPGPRDGALQRNHVVCQCKMRRGYGLSGQRIDQGRQRDSRRRSKGRGDSSGARHGGHGQAQQAGGTGLGGQDG